MARLEASVITTYRCNYRCHMCGIWQNPSRAEQEFRPLLLEKLPDLHFCNVTGGEPFVREDIEEITSILKRKSRRLVFSTNGYDTDKILALAGKFKNIGFRISLEGLPAANDRLRGKRDSFDRGLRTLLGLQRMNVKDIGFGITVSEQNAGDMLELFQLAKAMKVEFATAVVHNSYYFHKHDNELNNHDKAINSFFILRDELLKTWRIKSWYRAYFNNGLINYIRGEPRQLPCSAGTDLFFLDPWGEIRPCNGMEKKLWLESMGNLHDNSFDDIWRSEKAQKVRAKVRDCPKNCWMIGTAGPAIRKHLLQASIWVIKNKFRVLLNQS